MATLGERVATLEQIARESCDRLDDHDSVLATAGGYRQKIDDLWEYVNGGPNRPYRESARARLHDVTQALNTADKLADALREVRRERARQWSRWEKIGLFVFAALAAIAPYVLLAVGH